MDHFSKDAHSLAIHHVHNDTDEQEGKLYIIMMMPRGTCTNEIMIDCTDDDFEGNLCRDNHEGGNCIQ